MASPNTAGVGHGGGQRRAKGIGRGSTRGSARHLFSFIRTRSLGCGCLTTQDCGSLGRQMAPLVVSKQCQNGDGSGEAHYVPQGGQGRIIRGTKASNSRPSCVDAAPSRMGGTPLQ